MTMITNNTSASSQAFIKMVAAWKLTCTNAADFSV